MLVILIWGHPKDSDPSVFKNQTMVNAQDKNIKWKEVIVTYRVNTPVQLPCVDGCVFQRYPLKIQGGKILNASLKMFIPAFISHFHNEHTLQLQNKCIFKIFSLRNRDLLSSLALPNTFAQLLIALF